MQLSLTAARKKSTLTQAPNDKWKNKKSSYAENVQIQNYQLIRSLFYRL